MDTSTDVVPGRRLAEELGALGPVPVEHERRSGRHGGAPVEAPGVDAGVDWALVVRLRREASDLIAERAAAFHAELGRPMPLDDRQVLGGHVVSRVVKAHAERLTAQGRALWTLAEEQAHVRAVHDAIFGFGRFQPLFEIPDAENNEIHGFDHVYVQYGDGHRETHAPVADSDDELVEAVRFLGETANPPRPFDDAHPMMTVALGDRFRLHAIGFRLADRPSVVIRQHILTDVTLAELVADGMLPEHVGRLLHDCVLARKSMVISGDQGAGKTTLLRALVAAIPPTERFGTLETDYELLTHLRADRRNMVALQAQVGVGELHGDRLAGEYTVADLIPEALRQNLARLIVGEVRGNEAGAMFDAMNSGTGAMATTHSHSAASTTDRLASRVAHGGVVSIDEAYRQIAHNLHLLIHVRLTDDTWRGGVRRRYVSEIRSLTGSLEGGRPVTHLVYQAATTTRDEVFHPDPQLVDELAEFGGVWEGRR